jgi:hypothetical protein
MQRQNLLLTAVIATIAISLRRLGLHQLSPQQQ